MQLWQGGLSADESLGSSNTMTLGLIDKMKEKAITNSPLVRPISVKEKGGEIGDYYEVVQQGKYLMYMHPLN